jgi:N-acetylgalactosamine 4-sulfate 6-O-sulfotransferase
MSCITGAMWMSMQRARVNNELLKTEWRSHWSQTQIGSASKTVFEQSNNANGKGINVHEEDQSFQEYMDEDRYPTPDEADYYDSDRPDVKEKIVDREYIDQYQHEVYAAKLSQANKTAMQKLIDRYHPVLRDYSLKREFNNPFKFLPEEDINFVTNYNNPCWAESVPKFPYSNNSYLMVSEQARQLEPQFQAMRKRFAHLDSDTKWRMRCLPAFYVMESPPLATPGLYTALGFHPLVVNPQLSEPEYWNQKGPDGTASLRDYLDLFDAAAQDIRENVTRVRNEDGTWSMRHLKLTGDGTTSYLWTFDTWRKVKGNEEQTEPKVTAADIIFKLTPLAKFVFVLRNPTDRLFQGYLTRTDAPSATDFHEKAGLAMEKISTCEKTRSMRSCIYDGPLNKGLPVRLRIGMYYPFIADWLRVFPAEQIKVVRYEDYVSSPSQVINEVCKFLGLPPFPTKDLELVEQRVQSTETKRKADQKVKMMSTTKAMLKEFHRVLNQELATLLDDDRFTWPELAAPFETSGDTSVGEADRAAKEQEFRQKKEKVQLMIREQRRQQVEEQQAKMAAYRDKLRIWAEEQRKRRRQQEEERGSKSAVQSSADQSGQQSAPQQQQQQQPQPQQWQQQQQQQQQRPWGTHHRLSAQQQSQQQQQLPQDQQPRSGDRSNYRSQNKIAEPQGQLRQQQPSLQQPQQQQQQSQLAPGANVQLQRQPIGVQWSRGGQPPMGQPPQQQQPQQGPVESQRPVALRREQP